MPDAGPPADAIILAGGRATRLGGVDKPGLVVGERSLIASVISAACTAGVRRMVVVGPDRAGLTPAAGELRLVREDPPGGGPVPALRRGLAEVAANWVFLLAADLPFLRADDLSSLRAAAAAHRTGAVRANAAGARQTSAVLADEAGAQPTGAVRADEAGARRTGAVLADDSGRPQWLAGCWPVLALRGALAGYQGHSLHGLLGPLDPVLLAPPPDQPDQPGPGRPPPWLDCDTPQDVRQARAWSNLPAGDRETPNR